MYAQRYRLRLIYGVILLALVVWTAWMATYSGTHVPPTKDGDWCVIGSAEVAPCPT